MVLRPGTVAALVTLAALCGGQEPARERVFGLVRTEDGEPWVGATVELLARPIPDDVTVGVADRVVATTDDGGRFRVAILRGLAYSAWAWRADGEGSYRTSEVVDGIVPRDAVLMTRRAGLRHLRRIEFAVADGVALPLEVRVRAETAIVRVELLDVDADLAIVLPPLPPVRATVEVRDAAGVPLMARVVDPARTGVIEVAVPLLGETRIAVRDVHSGRGVPDAFVVVQTGTSQVRLGGLAADGCGTVPDPAFGTLIVYAKGRAPATAKDGCSPDRGPGREWPVLREGFVADHHAHPGAGVVVRGRVVLGGRPAAGAWLAIHEYAMHYSETHIRAVQPVRRAVQVAADGSFEVEHLLEEFPPAIDLVLLPEHVAALPASWRGRLHSVVPMFLTVDKGEKGDGERDFGDVDLLELVPVSLQVVDPDGVPALGATVQLLRPWGSMTIGRAGGALTVDRSGRSTVLLSRQRQLVMVVETRSGAWDLFAFSTGDAARVAEPVDIRVAMRRPIVVTGRLIDREGEAAEGYALSLRPALRGFEWGRPDSDSDDATVSVARVFDPRVLLGVLRTRRSARPRRTDAEGRFRVQLPRVAMRYRLDVAGTWIEFDVEEEGEPEPLEIEISR